MGVSPYLPMAQLSRDQFWGVLFKITWKFNFENNLQVKQHNFHRRCPIILNKNFVWGPCEADWEYYPWPSLRTSPGRGGGNCAYVARGIVAPGIHAQKPQNALHI